MTAKAPDARDRADLLAHLQLLQRQSGYSAATVADRDGNIRLESEPGRMDPVRIRAFARSAARRDEPALEDLYEDAVARRPLMALTAPVSGAGALVLAIDPDVFLFPYIRSWPAPSATAETVLGRVEGEDMLYLNELRHWSAGPFRVRRLLTDWERMVVREKRPVVSPIATDYRGVSVLRVVRPVPESPWYLAAKIDASEAYAPVRRLGWEMALIIALIAGANAAGAGFIWGNLQAGIHKRREQWFRQAADETPAYLWMASSTGEPQFFNRQLADFLGGDLETAVRRWRDSIHPGDQARVTARMAKCVAERSEYVEEHRLRRSDGEYRWVRVHARPRFTAQGEFQGYAGSLLDITKRKNAQEAERRSAALMAAQNQALKLIATGASLEATFDVLLHAVEAQSPGAVAAILLLAPDGVHFKHASAPSLPESYRRAIENESAGRLSGLGRTSAFTGETVVAEDIATDPCWEEQRDLSLAHGLRACWSTPIFDGRGGIVGMFALYLRSPGRPQERDRELIHLVTQTASIAIARDRQVEALRLSEERLRLAVTSGNVGVWEWDVETNRLVWTHQPGADGDAPATLSAFLETIHPDDRARVEAGLRRAVGMHGDYEEEYRTIRPDGEVRWMHGTGRAECDASGKPVRMRGVRLDITSGKQDEERIKRSQAQLARAQAIAHTGSYEWDIASNRVAGSEELCRIFGVLRGEFATTWEAYLERVHPEDRPRMQQAIEAALRDATPFEFEERIVRPTGEIRFLHSQGEWIVEDGRPVTLVGICQDVTERTQAEQEIKALSARLIYTQEEERARLARELHDDLSQQIAALSIALSRLRKSIPSELADAREAGARIQEKLLHLSESVRRLSHQLHPAVLQHAGVSAALTAFCSEFTGLTGIHVTLETEGELQEIPPAIALCVYRVVQEALQNVARHAKVKEARVALRRADGVLSVAISDRGAGMDLNRTSARSGLGLVSIRERARLVNGAIRIDSRPGEGTLVTLTVPVPTPAAAARV